MSLAVVVTIGLIAVSQIVRVAFMFEKLRRDRRDRRERDQRNRNRPKI